MKKITCLFFAVLLAFSCAFATDAHAGFWGNLFGSDEGGGGGEFGGGGATGRWDYYGPYSEPDSTVENDSSLSGAAKCQICLAATENAAIGFASSGDNKGSLFATILASFIREGGAGCWFCPLFKKAFNTINTIATNLYYSMQDIFVMLLALGGGFWLLWIVLQFLLTLHGPNVGEFMTNLFKALGKILVAAWLLYAPAPFLFGIIVDPVVLIATNLSRDIMSASGMNPLQEFKIVYPSCEKYPNCNVSKSAENYLCNPVPASDKMFEDTKRSTPEKRARKALSPEIYNSFTCYLKTVSLSLITGMAAGAVVTSYGFFEGPWYMGGLNPQALLIGLVVELCYLIYLLMVPFKLIDLLVRLGFIFIMLPFFVVCWVFPATRQYAKKGWDMIISCLFTLLCLTVFIIIGLSLIEGVLQK